RGYRVELGDIESLLKQHPDIADAWVDVRRNAAATPLLVAFYCSVNGVALDAQQLRVWLSLRLPLHMLPLLYVPLSAMPLGVNGKIDPQCLPLVDLRQLEGPGEYVPPATELEQRLAEIWQQLLGLERVGTTTNFFDLGGHSLLLVQMQQYIGQQCGQHVALVDLLRFTTIKRLAEFLLAP
ncbi:phosphopantetheine-binding protein, partial [Klebsiella pneumoniae]